MKIIVKVSFSGRSVMLMMFFIVKEGCGEKLVLLAMKNIVKVADPFG
ncbi:hypothetical protein [Paenibacillus eucommiae]|uniref:Uncharacterized protein n=1 Tax=Paenibacillus eucommiae TaxID=1355755 RepID=A0ABS4IW47_9BACL|nr:hypothetical protein [Paenibacillus eucommiae]MBP1991821.1 hypothetical protein [Paenibacillus eucommiae]